MNSDPQNASDPRTADHHWFPFLRYQEKCKEEGKEATVSEWLRSRGKLDHQMEYEKQKEIAIIQKAEDDKAKEAAKKAKEAMKNSEGD